MPFQLFTWEEKNSEILENCQIAKTTETVANTAKDWFVEHDYE